MVSAEMRVMNAHAFMTVINKLWLKEQIIMVCFWPLLFLDYVTCLYRTNIFSKMKRTALVDYPSMVIPQSRKTKAVSSDDHGNI